MALSKQQGSAGGEGDHFLTKFKKEKNCVQVIDIPSHSSLEDRMEVAGRVKEETGTDRRLATTS